MILRHGRSAYTLLEMFTSVAALVIVLGLMVSLSRRVRNTSATDLTKDLLHRLDVMMAQYQARYHQLPQVTAFIDPDNADPNEQKLQQTALRNNLETMSALRREAGAATDAFNGLPDFVFDEAGLRDAWGTPIVFMPQMHPAIGMAPRNHWFFFSAGPDRLFLTQEDNLYSYEQGIVGSESMPNPHPASQPAGPGGQTVDIPNNPTR